MLFEAATSAIILAAGLVSASPAAAEKREPDRVQPPLPKRTTHTGLGTVYTQNGVAGSCGNANPDSAIIGALSNYWMQGEFDSPYCGRLIQINNTGSDDGVGGAGTVITIEVQDTCESCGEGDIDLSIGAWDALTNSAAWGTVDISWHFCNVNGQC